jgi:hypothetical protein
MACPNRLVTPFSISYNIILIIMSNPIVVSFNLLHMHCWKDLHHRFNLYKNITIPSMIHVKT